MSCKHIVIGLCQDVIQTGSLLVDTIDELSGFGVTIEGILFKDGVVDGRDISVDGANLDAHIVNNMNPHNTTKEMLGLGELDVPTFSNVISTNLPTIGNHLATKDYVDGVTGNNFGSQFTHVKKNTIMSTTNTFSLNGYITYLNTLTASLPLGEYRIGWSYEYSNDSQRDLLITIEIDGAIKTRNRLPFIKTVGNNGENSIQGSSTNQRYTNSGFLYINFATTSTHNININFTRSDEGIGNGAVSLINAQIELWKVL